MVKALVALAGAPPEVGMVAPWVEGHVGAKVMVKLFSGISSAIRLATSSISVAPSHQSCTEYYGF